MGTLFGTDGVRGIANIDLTPELAFDLGRAGSHILANKELNTKPKIIVGKDTRLSCDMLEAALIAGICSTGADVLTVGVLPTPAIAYLTSKYEASCGIVISASHNPVEDNGIKFFGPTGFKLKDEIEDEIEKLVKQGTADLMRPQGTEVGRVYEVNEALNDYLDYLVSIYDLKENLSNLTIVLDCANGSAFEAGPQLFERLGAKVIAIHNTPTGVNINEKCGSTHTESIKKAVVENKADLGIAYDGDADRCIAIDEKGNEIDGDFIMVICSLNMLREGKLNPSKIVATVMSNIGLEIALKKENIAIENCKVGDRYVLEKMQETGALLGGEQSGHIIFLEHATTGDGLLTSLKIAEVIKNTGLSLSTLTQEMEKQPQILVNIKIAEKDKILSHPLVVEAINQAEQRLGEWGKLVVRPSGTEPKVRIMAQGPDKDLLTEVIDDIKKAVETVQ
ncbi:Phosphoglucosamine mutase [Candidatus Syntrophocurvum alkaliphilum]|uniref:Phosphoglucosamine mutase n=1 Tax=Candidatus Syntrophocurvum alkaliphilum TaxID=2293317 RepID=A0A6I6DIQ6_9FIRM|nr:phosphoglucosamine mutase [Candidatus Syntrophocurvum alkaliphilum]QGU00883.1 Phosphoglucosamine mutase [Candidatus Syntrophocurvum alkaliphilum]